MAGSLTPRLSILFFAFILLNLPSLTISDDKCPYPCYPPPTGSGGTPVITTPPPSWQPGSYPPPGNYPSPTGNLPYNYPPPAGSNNGNYYFGPPPPDPILPYFPFYYRKPPHQTDQSSATELQLPRSTVLTATTIVHALVCLVFGLWLM